MPEQLARFCIDENSFRLKDEEPAHLDGLFEQLIHLIRKIKTDEQEIVRWSELEYVCVLPEIKLVDLIYNIDVDILDQDVKKALGIILERCHSWGEDFNPKDDSFNVKGIELTGKSLEYVFEQVLNGRAVSCVCINNSSQIHGQCRISRGNDQTEIYFLANEEQITPFYRSVYETENLSDEEYIGHAKLAFPQLYFVQDIHRQFRKFKESYSTIRPKITRHLSIINDDFRLICKESNNNYQDICNKFDSKGVDISRESPNTRHNQKAMREREIKVDGISLVCEWHTKLNPQHDRIHFHEGRSDVAEGKIIIGIFTDHLST